MKQKYSVGKLDTYTQIKYNLVLRNILIHKISHIEEPSPDYRNGPKFSDRYVWANSADPDQRCSLIRVYTVCHSVCIVWLHYFLVEPHSSNFRVITTIFLGVRIFRKFTVRISSYILDTDIGRYAKLDRADHLCTKCSLGVLGDEIHFLIVCPALNATRQPLVSLVHDKCKKFVGMNSFFFFFCFFLFVCLLLLFFFFLFFFPNISGC